jgi:hypothetical protein
VFGYEPGQRKAADNSGDGRFCQAKLSGELLTRQCAAAPKQPEGRA